MKRILNIKDIHNQDMRNNPGSRVGTLDSNLTLDLDNGGATHDYEGYSVDQTPDKGVGSGALHSIFLLLVEWAKA